MRKFIELLCIALLCVATVSDATSPLSVSAPPKFGDRIGKLKRNFQPSTTSTTTTTTTTLSPSFENENDIHRSDDYFTAEDLDNKKFFMLKENPVEEPADEALNTSSLNKTFQLPAPSSSLVQARLEMLTDFFDVPPSPMPSVYSTSARPTAFPKTGVVLAAKNHLIPTNTTYRGQLISPRRGIRGDAWVIPVIVLAIVSMLTMAFFELFVLCKTRKTSPNRRHLFLGQMLLLGLFTCAGLSALLTARPSTLSCATIRFGTGVSFAIVFASLLVKCIFLISLNGGVYLPAPYQGLLLMFAVGLQVTIGVQWLITEPPGVTFPKEISQSNRMIFTAENFSAMKESLQICRTSFSEMRISLVYIDFLIIIVAILAIKSRGIRDNYREATYIGLAIALVIPVWLGWTLVGLAVHERHRDACLAFGLLATPSIVFLVMFMPKGRQLAAMGREDLYMEDREERFSASSRAGSGYSPSFFHFKPIKYGVMNGKSSGNESKHQQAVNTLGGGEFGSSVIYRLHCTKLVSDYALVVPYYTPPPLHNFSHHHHHHHQPHLYYYTYKQPPPPQYAGECSRRTFELIHKPFQLRRSLFARRRKCLHNAGADGNQQQPERLFSTIARPSGHDLLSLGHSCK